MSESILLQGQLHDYWRLLGEKGGPVALQTTQTGERTDAADEPAELTELRSSVPGKQPGHRTAAPLSFQILGHMLRHLDSYKDSIAWMPTSRSASVSASSQFSREARLPKHILTPDRIRECFEEVYGESIWSIVGTELKTRQILQNSSLRTATSSSTPTHTIPEYKVVLLGSQGSGKSSLLEQLTSNTFSTEYTPTVESQTSIPLLVDSQECILHILDTGGGECDFLDLQKYWLNEGDAFLLVYSTTDQASLDQLAPIREQIIRARGFDIGAAESSSKKSRRASTAPVQARAPVPMMIVGTKADLPKSVSTIEAQAMATRYGCFFSEVSSLARFNIPKCFYDLVRALRRVEGPAKTPMEAEWRKKETERRERELRLREKRMRETERQLTKWRKKMEKKSRKSRSPTAINFSPSDNTVWMHTPRGQREQAREEVEVTLEQLAEEGAIMRVQGAENITKQLASTFRLPEISDESYHSIQIRLQSFEFKVEEATELYISLYDNTRKFFLSEEYQLLLSPRISVLSIPLSTRTAVFCDIAPHELSNDILVVCRLLRKSPYHRFSDNSLPARFPTGYAFASLSNQLKAIQAIAKSKSDNSVPSSAMLVAAQESYTLDIYKTFKGYVRRFWSDGSEAPADAPDVVMFPGGLVLDVAANTKPYTQLCDLASSGVPTDFVLVRRQDTVIHAATADALKNDLRSDMYVTLVSGHFPSRAAGARPGCPIDVEVSMSIRLQSGWSLQDCLCLGRGVIAPTNEYNSPIMLRSQDPAWWETVRLANLPSGALHLYFQIRLIHPTESRIHVLHAYLRLVKDGTALQNGTYVLRVFANTTGSKDPAFYLKEQSVCDESHAADSLVVRLHLSSLIHTQCDTLTELSRWKQYPTPKLQQVLQSLLTRKNLTFRVETMKLFSRLLPMLLALSHSTKHVTLKNQTVQLLCAFTKNFVKLPHFRIILQHVLRTFKFSHPEDVSSLVSMLQVFVAQEADLTEQEDKFITFMIQMFEIDQISPLLSLALKKLFLAYELFQRSSALAQTPRALQTRLIPAVLNQLDFFLQGLAYRNTDRDDTNLILDVLEWLIFYALFQVVGQPASSSAPLTNMLSRLEIHISRLPPSERQRFQLLDLTELTASADYVAPRSILKKPGATELGKNVGAFYKPPVKQVTFSVVEDQTPKVSKTKYLRTLERRVERAAEAERLRLEQEQSGASPLDDESSKRRIVVDIGPKWKLRVPFPSTATVEDLISEIQSRIILNKPRLSSIGQTEDSLDEIGLRGENQAERWPDTAVLKDLLGENETVVVVWPEEESKDQ